MRNELKCPKCGCDWIRGIDPGEFFDGEFGWCNDCRADLRMIVMDNGDFDVEVYEPDDEDEGEGEGESAEPPSSA